MSFSNQQLELLLQGCTISTTGNSKAVPCHRAEEVHCGVPPAGTGHTCYTYDEAFQQAVFPVWLWSCTSKSLCCCWHNNLVEHGPHCSPEVESMFSSWAAWYRAVVLELIELKHRQELDSIDPKSFEVVKLLNESQVGTWCLDS